jgi:arginase
VGVVLVEVPFNSAGLTTGVARMPAALRDAGLHAALPDLERVVTVDVGEPVPERGPSGFLAEDALVRAVLGVRDAVLAGGRPIVVGGDCPVMLGALAALAERGDRPGLVFLDGHEDAWPPSLSPSGEAADSELGIALGRFPAPAGLAGVLPVLGPGAVLVLGPRDGDELRAAGCPSLVSEVTVIDGAALTAGEVAAVVADVSRAVGTHVAGPLAGPWWLHVDLDVLSTPALPAVDYPQSGGLSWERLEAVAGAALARPGCAGASVVIYNPDLDGGAAAPRIVRFVTGLAGALLRHGGGPAISWG